MTRFVPSYSELTQALPDADEKLLKKGMLSKNFAVHEFTRSATSHRLGISNRPDFEALLNLNALVDNVLQPARAALKLPLRITSGYRSGPLNSAVRGAPNSDHLYGRAADVETRPETDKNMWALGKWIEEHCDFKQLIWEFGGEWIHVSYQEGANRKQVLEAYRTSGGIAYKPFTFIS